MTLQAYLGDGVTASFDGFQIWLRTPRAEGVHEIALEPAVYRALLEFAKLVNQPQELER